MAPVQIPWRELETPEMDYLPLWMRNGRSHFDYNTGRTGKGVGGTGEEGGHDEAREGFKRENLIKSFPSHSDPLHFLPPSHQSAQQAKESTRNEAEGAEINLVQSLGIQHYSSLAKSPSVAPFSTRNALEQLLSLSTQRETRRRKSLISMLPVETLAFPRDRGMKRIWDEQNKGGEYQSKEVRPITLKELEESRLNYFKFQLKQNLLLKSYFAKDPRAGIGNEPFPQFEAEGVSGGPRVRDAVRAFDQGRGNEGGQTHSGDYQSPIMLQHGYPSPPIHEAVPGFNYQTQIYPPPPTYPAPLQLDSSSTRLNYFIAPAPPPRTSIEISNLNKFLPPPAQRRLSRTR